MFKVLMIVNPVSGKSHARKNLLDALQVFSNAGYNTEVYVTKANLDAKKYVLENGENYDLLVACGGDGTLNEVTSAVMKLRKKPSIGYFPSGTMNDFSSNFDLTNNWKETARKIVSGREAKFDVGQFNKDSYFNYVAAYGAFCDVPYATPQDAKNYLGNLAYLLEGSSRLNEIHPIKVKITIGDKTEELNTIVGLIFSGYRVSGMPLLEKSAGAMDDGQFNVLLVESIKNIFEISDYLKIFTKSPSKLLRWYKASEIKLEFEEEVVWTIDGEKAESGKTVKIKNRNKALKIRY